MFVHFDDYLYIIENSFIRDIHNLQNIWGYYPCRFITSLSFAYNFHFSKLEVFNYHLFNLVVHLCSAILVWWLTSLTFKTPAIKNEEIARHANIISLFVGLIFVSHPIQTEAVTYICQRASSLATLFYLASVCFYVKSRSLQEGKGHTSSAKIYYFSSIIFAIVAMFTKEIAITLPLMIFLYELSFFDTKNNLNWRRISPFLLTLFIIPITMLLTKSKMFHVIQDIAQEPGGISPLHYLFTQLRVMVTYIRLVFFPFNQNIDYDYPIFDNIFELPVLSSLMFLIIIFYIAQCLFLRYRLLSFSIFWFFLALLPESSSLPAKDVIFEHRLYLPLVGYSMFFVSSIYYVLGNKRFKVMVIILAIIVMINSFLTFQRNKVWVNDISLWGDTIIKSPGKARPYYTLGVAYDQQGDPTRAIYNLNKANAINPAYAEVYYTRGIFYEKKGYTALALSDYNKAIELNPDYAKAYYNRGNIYIEQNNFAQALSEFNKAIEKNTSYEKAYINRGNIYSRQGNFIQAVSDYNQAEAINPDDIEVYINRGTCYARQGDFDQALLDYNQIIALNPKYAQVYYNRAVIYFQLKSYGKAWVDIHKTEELEYAVNPGFLKALKAASGRDK